MIMLYNNKSKISILATASVDINGNLIYKELKSDVAGSLLVSQVGPLNVIQAAPISNIAINNVALSAYTTSQTATINNLNSKGLQLIVNVTAYTLGSLTPIISGIDLSGNKYPILTGPAIAAVGITALRVYPGLIAVANSVANDIVPLNIVLDLVAGTTDSITYEVNSNLIL